MKLVSTALASTMFVTLSLAGACDRNRPDGTTPPGGQGGTTADGGGRTDGGKTDGGKTDGGKTDGGKPKTCEAQTADGPQALFEEKVLVRPPVNVVLAEVNPTMAEAVTSGGFVSACGAYVDRMNLLWFPLNKKQTLKQFHDDFVNHYLAKGGYAGGTPRSGGAESATDIHQAIEYPAANGQPASVLYIAAAVRFDTIYVMLFQTRPDEFEALKPTFEKSAKSLLVQPPK